MLDCSAMLYPCCSRTNALWTHCPQSSWQVVLVSAAVPCSHIALCKLGVSCSAAKASGGQPHTRWTLDPLVNTSTGVHSGAVCKATSPIWLRDYDGWGTLPLLTPPQDQAHTSLPPATPDHLTQIKQTLTDDHSQWYMWEVNTTHKYNCEHPSQVNRRLSSIKLGSFAWGHT